MSAKSTIIGRIYYISEIETVGQNGFQKRFIVIDDSRTKDGKTYPNWIQVDFTGERMALLDAFVPDQLVQIEAFIEGREYQGKYYHNLRGASIQQYVAPNYGVPSQQPQPQPGGYQNAAPTAYYGQPQGHNVNQPPQQNANGYGPGMFYSKPVEQPQTPNPFGGNPTQQPPVGGDDLPF